MTTLLARGALAVFIFFGNALAVSPPQATAGPPAGAAPGTPEQRTTEPLTPSASGPDVQPGIQVLRVTIDDHCDGTTLLRWAEDRPDVEVWTDRIGDFLDVRVDRRARAWLDANQCTVEVLVEDLRDLYADLFRGGGSFFDQYRSYDEHVAFMNDLVAAYPELAEIIQLGTSVQGRPLWAIRITGPGSDKPGAMYHGAQHGNEIMGAAAIAYTAQQLLAEYAVDPEVAAIVDGLEWYLLPIMNPDGYVLGWRHNANGVDLNRNWGGPGSGSNPFSQPETDAMRVFFESHPNVKAHVDLHTYGYMIMWPWGHKPELTEDNETFSILGTLMAERIYEIRGTNYPWRGPIYTTIYPVAGGSVDYSYSEHQVWSILIEIGNSHYMPAWQIHPTAQEMHAALTGLSGWMFDCNVNGANDFLDIQLGESEDCNANATPDECELQSDFDGDGVVDACDDDSDGDGVPNVDDICPYTPLGIPVDAVGRPLGDTHGDCVVDYEDYWRFSACFVGFLQPEVCQAFFDFDSSGTVDLRDFVLFQNAFMGSDR